jgi:hypothetical protein
MRKQAQQWGDLIVHATVPVSLAEAIFEATLPGYNSFVITGDETVRSSPGKVQPGIEKQYRWALFNRT